jgi:Uma2 family endonuclease
VDGLVEEQRAPRSAGVPGLVLAGRHRVSAFLVVPEDEGHVHVPGAQHAQRLRRLRLGEHEVHAGMLGAEPGRRGGHDRAQRGGKRREPHPARSQPRVRGQLVFRRVQPAEDLGRPVGEQPPGVGEPDAPAGPLDQLGPGLRLQPGQMMAHRRLRVVEGPGRGGHRPVPGHRDEHAQPGHIEHLLTIEQCDPFAPGRELSVADVTLFVFNPLRSEGNEGDDETMAAMARLDHPVMLGHSADVASAEELYERMEPIPGFRVELLGGRIVVSPYAGVRHQWILYRLVRELFEVADKKGWGLLTPMAVYIEATRDRPQPDLVVASRAAPQYNDHELFAHGVPLVAEIVSPTSRHDDRGHKPLYYAQGRVPLYLLIDPEAERPTVTLFSEPHPTGYRSRTEVPIGEKLKLPDPFGMILDTASLLPDSETP